MQPPLKVLLVVGRLVALGLPVIVAATPSPAGSASAHYRDGNYKGPTVDAYWGTVRVQATVKNGQLIAVKVLDYPADRQTSRYINRQALPMLEGEVISAQSAYVDTISGATLTSEAYLMSLDAALSQASS